MLDACEDGLQLSEGRLGGDVLEPFAGMHSSETGLQVLPDLDDALDGVGVVLSQLEDEGPQGSLGRVI